MARPLSLRVFCCEFRVCAASSKSCGEYRACANVGKNVERVGYHSFRNVTEGTAMPSWNIHTAHVERLLQSEPPESLGICDRNAFLFGNFVPDIYVGYVVQPISHKIEYRDTHFADPGFVPTPDAALFYRRYVRQIETSTLSDLTLGAWTHLICDHYYNLRNNEFIASIGVKPGNQTRIRKQADFASFGRTLSISLVPYIDDDLLRACAAFPQYAILEEDVRATIRAQRNIVIQNQREHLDQQPAYRMLTSEFFSQTFAEVDNLLREALHLNACGADPTHIGRPADGTDERLKG